MADNPSEPAIIDALGRAEFRAGHYRSAKRYFDQALPLAKAGRTAILANSASASLALGESHRAEALARQALELEPEDVRILKLLSQSLQLQKRNVEAKAILERILAIRSDPVARGDLAFLYLAERQRGKALELLLQAVAEVEPGQARARLLTNLGWLYWELGMRAASANTLQLAVAEAESSSGPSHPDTARILERYSEVLRRTGRKAQSKIAAERASRIRSMTAAQTNENLFTIDWRDGVSQAAWK